MSWLARDLCFVVLAVLAARGARLAYVAYVALCVLFMPAIAGFQFSPRPCEVAMSMPLAVYSLRNYEHIWRFAIFFVATRGQFRADDGNAFVKAAIGTIAMGVVVEIEQALIGRGHCRVRDLIPDAVGGSLGALLVVLSRRMAATRQAA